ncbi:uncharacterized protein A4U43_C06F18510 [Asparagus officinalis]|uniref:DUF4005 domain-containing protein n=1 Tax=Asparagus officinalis TaxID=4686 RepID=A0A5P1ERT2_ASPOF|nr:protein IQ-DOMAIN 1-like [Asparagus officinalis]XP_020269138.1 protein IQ-DOMAIN 1-like [Asparagus officinalis]ONK67281.1 uncharacterized protein A4U43_C06F18510 [Asparagus officinalis]
MGISSKWLKSLVGIKKQEKSRNSNDDANKSVATSHFRHRRRQSVDLDDAINEEEVVGTAQTGDLDIQSRSSSASSTSQHVQISYQTEQSLKEEWAATVIQTAFRAFLARQALRALKGLVRLQALVRGHAVRKQAAITLHCMQALVRVQARVRARRVRMTLENQIGQQHLVLGARVREIEEGWCDGVGSVEDVQAKLLKRQEAAVKRERAMAYALTHQWQAGSKQRAVPEGFEPDKNNWGWKWLDRWMAARPWENRFLDTYVKDGMTTSENESAEGKVGIKPQIISTVKKPISAIPSNISNHRRGPSQSEGSGSSSGKSKPKASYEEATGEATSKPSGIGPRSDSLPKERPAQINSQPKKRLSLQGNGVAAGKHSAYRNSAYRNSANRSFNAHKSIKEKTKQEAKS